jgi:hypothetical protein
MEKTMLSSSLKFAPGRIALGFSAAVPVLSAVALIGIAVPAYGQAAADRHGAAPARRSPSLWYVDITRKGTQCVVDPSSVKLWRAFADEPAKVRLSGPANFPFAAIEFAAGESVVEVDSATFPIGDGASVTISDAQTGATIGQIDFAVLPAQSGNSKNLAEALKERACIDQLDMLQGSAKSHE